MSDPDTSRNAQAPGAAPGGALALIVEDNQTLTSTLEALLDDEGYVTRTARSMAGARATLAATRPDVVLLDLTLLDGFAEDLLRELKAAAIPTLVVSTFPLANVIAERHGVALVRKPFELEVLLKAIQRARFPETGKT